MPPKYPDVNGVRTSWASIEFGLDGLPITGIESINYRDPLEKGAVYGSTSKKQGRTRGQLAPEGDMEILQADWLHILLPRITQNGKYGFSELAFPVKCAYAERLSPADVVTDRIQGVVFHSPEVSNSRSVDAIKIKVTFDVMEIIWANKYRSLRTHR